MEIDVDDYKFDENGIITTPGKFQGEPGWILQLWEKVMGGFADESVHDGSTAYDAFKLTDEMALLTGYPARSDAYVVLWSDDKGFVSHMTMTEDMLFACEGNDTTEYFVVDEFDDHHEYESGF